MKTHDVVQGSPEWHAHRALFRNASDAPAMMGCSAYKTRTQLLQECATGIHTEVDAATLRRFDDGHRFEALCRPRAEKIIGQELYPVVGSNGRLSASFDGLTMLEDIAFEHKSLNDELRAILHDEAKGSDLPLMYRVQMEQQCMVSGCERVLFMASKWNGDTLVDERFCWYEPDAELRAAILRGWDQFDRDLAEYTPTAAPVEAVATAIESLPALVVTVEGRVTASNLIAFRESADRFIAKIKTDLQTDQDFADAEQTVKFCKDGEDRLELVKKQALAQTASIEELFRTIDHISEQMRQKRLALDKLVKSRKETIRAEIVAEAQAALDAHVVGLNARLGSNWVPRVPGNFGEAIKGKKTVASVRDAVSTALAGAKIATSALADCLGVNRKALASDGHDWFFLFADFATVGTKDAETFAAIAAQRIGQHKAAEDAREAKRKADEAARAAAQAEVAAKNAEAQPPQQVLKAEPATADATDRGTAATVSPRVGAMGAGQAADAAPAAEPATLSLGAISGRLGFTVSGDFLRDTLHITPAKTDKLALLYTEAQFQAICRGLRTHMSRLEEQYAGETA